VSDSDRITRLETHFEYIRRDLDEIKTGQKEAAASMSALIRSVDHLPTKDDLWTWKIQWLAIGVALLILIVGGIVGGLDFIKNH
jgi:hypothetical protein